MSRPFIPAGPPRFAHQKVGLKRLLKQRGVGALVFDPGLGKTATTIDYLSVLALASGWEEVRVLVICPLAAVDTWVQQMETYVPEEVSYWAEVLSGTLLQRAEALASRGGRPFGRQLSTSSTASIREGRGPRTQHFHRSWMQASRPEVPREDGPDALPSPRIVLEVLNMDALAARHQVGSRTMADIVLDAVKRFGPHVAVVDELHKAKGATSNTSRLLARIQPHVPRRLGLTGTVMPHGPLDVFAQWRWLDPTAFGTTLADGSRKAATFGGFRDRYAQMGGYLGREVVGYRNLDEMQEVMAELAVVARKDEALDLPETTDVTVPVELSTREKKAYAELKKSLATSLSGGEMVSVSSMLTQMMRLRQITSGHLPDDQGTVHVIGDSKVQTIRSLVHDTLAGEKRIVIFALFKQEIRELESALSGKGTEVLTISGDTPGTERQQMRQRFGSEDPARLVMVAQIKTMSLAVNELVTASHAIFASMSQQRDDYQQARDRLNRLGQSRPVTFWHAVVPGTVDDVILQAHRDRTSLESAMLRHIQGED